MSPRNKKLAQEWFQIGQSDFRFAKAGLEELKSFYPQICFLCQQAVEKYLKGFMVFHKRDFPKIHDLTQLARICGKINKGFLKIFGKTDILTQYYLTSRYPLEYQPAGKSEAKQAIKIAEGIIRFVETETSREYESS